ncbi:asparagine synthase (glutamine-hydrolyzing) [Ferruginivarius sediminum]|uniref:asparagine synthase (glutamine-hydrolyzing) n=1 Tax=Ferruginivarius sediminum TaxID=2661937 RepID=A0A369T4B6_9PROT|nr:asparagine synthase (glutamine-hydrolyzing) [Ferruginivarius sediminum]RDD60183.1 asparagine synthase (glutamine-hydrolyzing) [Ferruginivarius sediminum]
MCGIAGICNLSDSAKPVDRREIAAMNRLMVHRGPDDEGIWLSDRGNVGLGHRRLEIIDLSSAGHQPMEGGSGTQLVFNGEIYNYRELRKELRASWDFHSKSDSEVILAAYEKWGKECPRYLRGMFAFAIWDPRTQSLFAARDRFGIKPFHYFTNGNQLFFASEMKALMPFLENIETDYIALSEYLAFQFTLGDQTMFYGVRSLSPGHMMNISGGQIHIGKYWDISYELDFDHTPKFFHERLRELLDDSVQAHLLADVPIGSYLSGGIDSSLIAILASRHDKQNNAAFHGKFTSHPGYDESRYAEAAARAGGKELHQASMTAADFLSNIEKVIYHLDQPTAGPGSFPQFMISGLAAQHVKVILGGQGGDEIFAGYARYLIAYFEQCLKAAIEGTYHNGDFVVTAESIIPNLSSLEEYKPLLKQFWEHGLFDDLDERYLRLIDRSADMDGEVDPTCLNRESVVRNFQGVFNGNGSVHHRAYLDKMTHFDFKTLLPALLHVEDRVSMAHSLESRVPLLDHPLIEFVATVPADVKFRDGKMKTMLKQAYSDVLPKSILGRRDKMGFPVPLNEWYQGELRDFVQDIFGSQCARQRDIFNVDRIRNSIDENRRFSRKLWGLMSIELWHRQFHDQAQSYRSYVNNPPENMSVDV